MKISEIQVVKKSEIPPPRHTGGGNGGRTGGRGQWTPVYSLLLDLKPGEAVMFSHDFPSAQVAAGRFFIDASRVLGESRRKFKFMVRGKKAYIALR